MPNRLSDFFSQWYKRGDKTAHKPINSPQYSVVGNELLNLFVDVRKRVTALEQPKEVQTHFANHGLEIQKLKDCSDNFIKHIEDHEKRLDDLDQKYISFLTSRIVSASVQRRDKRGRFKAVRGRHGAA